jgi:hypothetical protein
VVPDRASPASPTPENGIKGTIDSVAKFPDSVGIPGLGHKNVTSVTITPR